MIKDDSINYQRLATAQTFYRALGYRNIDTPWLVSPQAIVATLPPNTRAVESNFGCFVGSGEQGFIQMMLDGTLEPGRYQTTTPCARDEQEYTDLSRKTFMKLELIHYLPEDARAAYEKVLNEAIACFFEISNVDTFEAVPTNDGFDITLNGIEIGSYGVRQMDKHVWVYGTGLAEPRFSLALSAPAPAQAWANPEPPAAAPASASA